MGQTSIEWTEHSFNPVVGCTKASLGCQNCYALQMAVRLAHNPKLPADVRERYISTVRKVGGKWEWSGKVALFPERLDEPLGRRKPTRYFVPSMGDLFHKDVPFWFVRNVWGMMALCPQHTFQVLTKRPKRMLDFVSREWVAHVHTERVTQRYTEPVLAGLCDVLPNIWLGTSVENQAAADERIPLLLQTPAAVRFVSCEPLLEEIDLTHLYGHISFGDRVDLTVDALSGKYVPAWAGRKAKPDTLLSKIDVGKLDWVICGTESGPGARPWDWDWIRNLRDQCQVARVPFFLKQVTVDGKKVPLPELDGRTWSEMPGQAQEVEVEG